MNYIKSVAISLIALAGTASATPVLQIGNDGQLSGITGLFVESGSFREFYDVAFVDGTCAELFGGCDGPNIEDLDRINIHLAGAFDALFAALGAFTDAPSLITGCEDAFLCGLVSPQNIFTAGGGGFSATIGLVRAGAPNASISQSFTAEVDEDFRSQADRTFAVWTPAGTTTPGDSDPVDPGTVDVPAPPTAPIMLATLLLMSFSRLSRSRQLP